MKEKHKTLKSNHAITLIALIITIIILLILAMVSINLVVNEGIITKAKYAVEKYKEAEQNEIDQLNSIFGNNEEQNNAPDELQKYVLGEDLKGQPLENICNIKSDYSFPNKLNGENIEYLNQELYFSTDYNKFERPIYIKYKNKAYRILCDDNYVTEKSTTKDVNLIYEPKGREGQEVEYSIDGSNENKKEWTILYDNGDNVEIISPESIGSLRLGADDKQATGNNDFERTVNSYNNAIDRINTYTINQVTNTNKLRVRSVGSNPNNPDDRNTNKIYSEELDTLNGTYEGIPITVNGIGEGFDNNYEQDLVRMSFWKVEDTGKPYWLASRWGACVNTDEIIMWVFSIRYQGHIGSFLSNGLWCASNQQNRARMCEC